MLMDLPTIPCNSKVCFSFSTWLFWIFVLIATDLVIQRSIQMSNRERKRRHAMQPNHNIENWRFQQRMYREPMAWILYPSKILYAFLIKSRAFSTRRGIAKECIPCHSSRCKDLSLAIAHHSNVTVRMERSLQHFEQGMFLLSTRPVSNARGSSHNSLQL